MRGRRVCAMVLLAFPLVASLCGCGQENDQPRPEGQNRSASGKEMAPPAPPPPPGTQNGNSVPQAPAKRIVVSDVLASWESGKKDEAVEQLLAVRWDGPDVFAGMPLMKLSEGDFRALPADGRKRTLEEIIELIRAFRSLVRHVLATGEHVQASGDKETAKAHYEAVLHLGQAISSPERVLVIQQVGKPLINGSQERLSALK